MSETEPQFKGPAIAVVVPVHNGAAFLQQCLASLAAQTFGDFACFVVDDGSTDESAELAAAWESRDARFVVIHQRQSGVAAARAAGVTDEEIGVESSDERVETTAFSSKRRVIELVPTDS